MDVSIVFGTLCGILHAFWLVAPTSFVFCPHSMQLKRQLQQIESVMDTIVEGYYAGFNKSINNYSLILTLFIRAKDTCAAIQGMLSDAAVQLATRQKNLAS